LPPLHAQLRLPLFPTYISLDVPESVATFVVNARRALDPDFADLPAEIALAGSSGLGVLTADVQHDAAIAALDRLGRSFFPITTRFVRSGWFGNLQVYAVEVEPVAPLLALHTALSSAGLRFDADVPREYQPHCTLRWTQEWMTPRQQRSWNHLVIPHTDFVLKALTLYQLRPESGNAQTLHRVTLGG
jgi:hypothetical protein